jgi:hypothetical protein
VDAFYCDISKLIWVSKELHKRNYGATRLSVIFNAVGKGLSAVE